MTMFALQILGIVASVCCILFVFMAVSIQTANGEGDEPTPSWMVNLLFTSVFVLGFTLGTLI